MKRRAILSVYCFQISYHRPCLNLAVNSSLFIFRRCLSHGISLGATHTRPFPDYSPKKPSIKDAELVHRISTTIKLRCSEPFWSILKPYESHFRSDHLIWVLMNIKNDYKLVLDLFDWACLRRDPSLEAHCVVVQIAAASKDLKTAHELIHNFWAKPKLDVGLSFARFSDRLIYTYKDWGSDPHVFDVFFRVLVETETFNEARKLFDKLLSYGLVISVDSCNLFLPRLSSTFDGIEMAIKFFNEYPEVGIHWNTTSYNIIIHCLCRLGKIKEAHHLLLQMELRGCVPDVVSCSTLISRYCYVRELQKVLKLIEEMKIKGLKQNSYAYNGIILFLCKTGKLSEAEGLLREMMVLGVLPDNVGYTTLTNGLCKSGNMVEAEKLVEQMEGAGPCSDTITYTTLMDAYCKMRDMAKAQKVLREMLDRGLQPTVVTFNVVMNGFCMAGMVEDAERLLKWMLEKGIVPNAATYNSLMKQYCIRNNMRTTADS